MDKNNLCRSKSRQWFLCCRGWKGQEKGFYRAKNFLFLVPGPVTQMQFVKINSAIDLSVYVLIKFFTFQIKIKKTKIPPIYSQTLPIWFCYLITRISFITVSSHCVKLGDHGCILCAWFNSNFLDSCHFVIYNHFPSM